ncbi:MAG: hypothetical protein IJ055_07110 [Oscillospiraceae bacterium]|nr:hypothetical protein [Oscillospiraceae bacterium]
MGAQFWWFYDVLTLSIAACALYAAVSKGFNRMIFRLIGAAAALLIGVYGSALLQGWGYDTLFRDKIVASAQQVLAETDPAAAVYEHSQVIEGGEMKDEEEAGERLAQAADGTFDEVVCACVGSALQVRLTALQAPHERPLPELLGEHPETYRSLVEAWLSGDDPTGAALIEELYYRTSYTRLVRLGLFLLLECVLLIIVGIIAAMAGNLEEQMHIRRMDRPLGAFAGLVETAFILATVSVALRMLIMLTDNEMLLFNEETIGATRLFHWIYDLF